MYHKYYLVLKICNLSDLQSTSGKPVGPTSFFADWLDCNKLMLGQPLSHHGPTSFPLWAMVQRRKSNQNPPFIVDKMVTMSQCEHADFDRADHGRC